MQAASLLEEKRNRSDEDIDGCDERVDLPAACTYRCIGQAARLPRGRGGVESETCRPDVDRARLPISAAGRFLLAASPEAWRLRCAAAKRAGETEKPRGEGTPTGPRDDPPIPPAGIAEDGTVTVTCHRSDMGQGAGTSWPMVICLTSSTPTVLGPGR